MQATDAYYLNGYRQTSYHELSDSEMSRRVIDRLQQTFFLLLPYLILINLDQT